MYSIEHSRVSVVRVRPFVLVPLQSLTRDLPIKPAVAVHLAWEIVERLSEIGGLSRLAGPTQQAQFYESSGDDLTQAGSLLFRRQIVPFVVFMFLRHVIPTDSSFSQK